MSDGVEESGEGEQAVGEHHVDGDTISGGRWFGRGWSSPVGAANFKLMRGSEMWMH